ncbi:HAMP domain-containing histidine kinase [bacterium]|nr:HAMP domain-containing histidine kinase [bacterium]
MSRGPRLRTRLIVAYVAFVVPVLALSGLFYYETARRSLDRELGKGLVAVAGAVATRFEPELLASFRPGDEEFRSWQSYRAQLERMRQAAGLRRLLVFDLQFRSLLDTEPGLPIGTPLARLQYQRPEVEATLAGHPSASVLFRGDDGQWYKSGFAVVTGRDSAAVAVVAADAGADYLELVAGLGRWVILFVLLGAALTVAAGFFLARSVSRPVQRLVEAAERIGQGRLDRAVEVQRRAPREIGALAAAFNRMRQGLNEREESQRLMVASVAHEIRNPMSGIEMFAALARDEAAPGSEARGYIERVMSEVASLKLILNNFLEYARPAHPERESLDLESVAGGALDLVRPLAVERGAALELELDPQARTVFADRGQLARVLLNLLTNALQALPAGGVGRVRVASRPGLPGETVVEVSDNGSGMDSATVEKVFQPFFTTRDTGLGLGLAIVKKTLEENGGSIQVESAPGRGSTFRLTLPSAAAAEG